MVVKEEEKGNECVLHDRAIEEIKERNVRLMNCQSIQLRY
jgi:hypothetical protein